MLMSQNKKLSIFRKYNFPTCIVYFFLLKNAFILLYSFFLYSELVILKYGIMKKSSGTHNMFRFLLNMFYFQIVLLSLDDENLALKRFKEAFKDDSTVHNWMDTRGKLTLHACGLFFETRDSIGYILNVINTREYEVIKSFIMGTNMNLKELSNAYYQTFNIISSVQRILKLTEKYSETEIDDAIIYKEYDILYRNIELTVLEIGLKLNRKKTLLYYFDRKDEMYNESLPVYVNNNVSKDFIHSIDEMLYYDILPKDVETPVNVVANLKNFRYSKRCLGEGIKCFIKGKYKIVCSKDMFKKIFKCSFDETTPRTVDLSKYMDKPLSCNLTAVKILMILFHYYSEVMKKNTKYNIRFKGDNNYLITWSHSLKPRLEKVVRYWLRKKVKNLSERKIIPRFSSIGVLKKEYSTVKSQDTFNNPISTRLILLSCGHQLGLELIIDFFENFYMNKSSPILCNVCGMTIKILGSYDANIYKYKVKRMNKH